MSNIKSRYFEQGMLKVLPKKIVSKRAVLEEVAQRFEPGREYTEQEVNAVLGAIYDDITTLRRSLVDYGYMFRADDGSIYQVDPTAIANEA